MLDWLKDLYSRDAQHYVLETIPPSRQDDASRIESIPIEADKHYVRIWLSEMFLKEDQSLFQQFVPVLHSAVRLQFAANPAQELPYVAGPQALNLGKQTLGRGVQVNHALTNLLPFRGGTLSISAALVGYKTKDLFKEFVGVLNDVSSLFNVGQLSVALGVVDKAVGGIQTLMGAEDKAVHLVYYEGFGGQQADGGSKLRSGYKAVIFADEKKFDKTKLYVKQQRLCYGDSLESANALDGHDYMLLRIEAATARDDALAFSQFAKLLQDSVGEGLKNRANGDAMIQTARIAAFNSPDLTFTDKIAVGIALIKAYREAVADVAAPSQIAVAKKVFDFQLLDATKTLHDHPLGAISLKQFLDTDVIVR